MDFTARGIKSIIKSSTPHSFQKRKIQKKSKKNATIVDA
jgi:hypothetical protein